MIKRKKSDECENIILKKKGQSQKEIRDILKYVVKIKHIPK
jgi:hypothetical protein